MSELSRAKTGQREVMGLVQTGHGDRGGRVTRRPLMHPHDARQIVRTYRQRQTDESERDNPRRCSQRWSIR
jgi:hypothetical protein